jgi:hypothetical protein
MLHAERQKSKNLKNAIEQAAEQLLDGMNGIEEDLPQAFVKLSKGHAAAMKTLLAVLAMVLAMVLVGCGGSAFSVGEGDDGGGDVVVRGDGDDAGMHVVVPEAGTEAGEAETSPPDATPEATPQEAAATSCTCGDASSCFYSASEPASGYGTPYPVTTVVLTPSAPGATFTASVEAIPQPYHNSAWYDLDLSAFANGGTLYINGQVGDGSSTVSSYLLAQCVTMPPSGSTPSLEINGGVIDGAWTFPSYQFPAGTTVLHFGTEGSWGNVANAVNTNKVTVLVQP